MAMHATRPVIGIDTAKEELVIQHDDEKRHLAVDNTPAAIRQWLAGLPKEGTDQEEPGPLEGGPLKGMCTCPTPSP